MSPADRLKLQLFLALFCGAVGFLSTLLCCGTEYWLLASESCSRPGDGRGGGGGGGGRGGGPSSWKTLDGVRIFHEGLFWRCSFPALSHEFSVWDLWISNQPPSKLCQAAFLFPFPVIEPVGSGPEPPGLPSEPYEHHSAIVFRTFWSLFLVTGLTAVTAGGFVAICACPLANHKLFKAGGALQLCGGLCLLAVLLMYLMWVQVLDTLEQVVHHRRVSGCPSFHLSLQHGPSFLLAPVAVFFCLLAGLLLLLVGRSVRRTQLEEKNPRSPASDVHL